MEKSEEKKITHCEDCAYAKKIDISRPSGSPRIRGLHDVRRCMHPDIMGVNFTKTHFRTCHRYEAGKWENKEEELRAIREHGRGNA